MSVKSSLREMRLLPKGLFTFSIVSRTPPHFFAHSPIKPCINKRRDPRIWALQDTTALWVLSITFSRINLHNTCKRWSSGPLEICVKSSGRNNSDNLSSWGHFLPLIYVSEINQAAQFTFTPVITRTTRWEWSIVKKSEAFAKRQWHLNKEN